MDCLVGPGVDPATPESDANYIRKLATSLDEQFARTVTLLRQEFAALESRLVESVQLRIAECADAALQVQQDFAVQQLHTRLDMMQSRTEKLEAEFQSLKLVWMEKSQASEVFEEQLEAIQDQLAEFNVKETTERIGRIEKDISLGVMVAAQNKHHLASPVADELKATSLLLAGRLEVVEHRVASVCAAFGKQQRTDQAAKLSPEGQLSKRLADVFPEVLLRQEEMQSQLVAIQAAIRAPRESGTPMSSCSTAVGSFADLYHESPESQRSVWSQVEAPSTSKDEIPVKIAYVPDDSYLTTSPAPSHRRCMARETAPAFVNE